MKWYLKVLRDYAIFSGRARRQEYWMFILINMIISLVLSALSFGVLETLYALAVFVPSMAVSVRRLHDTDRSGWWLLVGLVPFLGILVLIYFFVLDGTSGPNRFGPDPKHRERLEGEEDDDDDDDDYDIEVEVVDDERGRESGGCTAAGAVAVGAVAGAVLAGESGTGTRSDEEANETVVDDAYDNDDGGGDFDFGDD